MIGSVMTNPSFGCGSDLPLSINYSMQKLFWDEILITVEQKAAPAIICNKPKKREKMSLFSFYIELMKNLFMIDIRNDYSL